MKTRAFLGMFLLLAFSGTCMGGWLDTTLENAGKKLGNRGVNDAGNSAYDGAKGNVRGSANEKSGEGEKDSSQARATSAGGATIEEAEAVYSKFDFVPGDKTIFFDDFSDTDTGEFPRKWTLDGPKGNPNNAVEVVEYQGKKFLRSAPGTKARGQDSATQYVRLKQKGDLPEKFTVEFDAILGDNGKGGTYGAKEYTLLLSKGKTVADPAVLDVDRLAGPDGLVAAETMKPAFQLLDPVGSWTKFVAVDRAAEDPERMRRVMARERWLEENVAVSGAFAREFVRNAYQEDRLLAGTWRLRGERVVLSCVTAPVLVVTCTRDFICPPAAALPLLEAVGSPDREAVQLECGHIGVVVGSEGPATFYPLVDRWCRRVRP